MTSAETTPAGVESVEECRRIEIPNHPSGLVTYACGTHTYLGQGDKPNDWPCYPRTGQTTELARVEWTWRQNAYIAHNKATTDRIQAEQAVERCRTANPRHDVGLVRRVVTRWTEAPLSSEKASTP